MLFQYFENHDLKLYLQWIFSQTQKFTFIVTIFIQ